MNKLVGQTYHPTQDILVNGFRVRQNQYLQLTCEDADLGWETDKKFWVFKLVSGPYSIEPNEGAEIRIEIGSEEDKLLEAASFKRLMV